MKWKTTDGTFLAMNFSLAGFLRGLRMTFPLAVNVAAYGLVFGMLAAMIVGVGSVWILRQIGYAN